ncbi:MAG: hypothetical protein M3478_13400 [Planctomycetota bacterium]|nr:hypothetical protein [Planctomycetota bacterium]
MPRRMANVLTLVSAVVCVGSAMVVGRSFFREDQVYSSNAQNHVVAQTTCGQLFLRHHHPTFASKTPWWSWSVSHRRVVSRRDLVDLDFLWGKFPGVRWVICWGSFGAWERFRFVILPLWLLPLLTAIAPARWWWKRREHRRRGFPVAAAGATSRR